MGATPLVRLGKPVPEELGRCARVSVREFGSTNVTVFEQEPSARTSVSTIVIRGATMNILDDLERAIDDGIHAYKVWGRGGCCEE